MPSHLLPHHLLSMFEQGNTAKEHGTAFEKRKTDVTEKEGRRSALSGGCW